ncbi:SurA N-terminal domain-containing protein [Campylobacter sp. VicNov18]|uniref:peptidylprolyl isomerase n=1 Tax=Campylobacter bilis TaxID=2691918 RepID=UPI00130EC882|nr:peptidylprolyl isomerase [Campylobacter bilis]MPV63475.1 peptidylprolyl isomerase [Campylobacter hepaticus]MBM0636974.1 peptidylprolyl isomerase [Campylobacter bilis]MCC8277686.1 SurA N-terminal domain-containing protein [Campylobacter bilis]MCC8299295.1 SurA N-terminal domain-containing protein [Campylobacter bilis]MCC8300595.1 SurA N-terminal domain-containing protein [Campylobacter bilis]
MLTWMQHHKKYLIVTIWVSTIAFVGAGFLGWGAYDFNLNRSSSVAIVGNEKIPFDEWDMRYKQILSYYNQISNGTLTQENAKDLGIENIALSSLIEDKLLLNFAKDLGIGVSENEILQKLANTKEFQNPNGDFNKTIYYDLLNANNLTPKDYETQLANEIIISKLGPILNISSKDEELKMLGSSYFMQDDLSIAKIDYNPKNINLDEEELKKLWNIHKQDYKTQKVYEISTYFLSADDEKIDEEELLKFYNQDENKLKYKDSFGKIKDFQSAKNEVAKDYALIRLKNLANAKFLDLKNKKDNFQKDINITSSDFNYPIELLNKAKNAELLRPVLYDNGYIIIRLNKTDPVRIKTFEEARDEVLPMYLSEQTRKNLEEQAKNSLADFKGDDIGFVSRDSSRESVKLSDKILNDSEFAYFLINVFNADQKSSYVLINDNKAILYKINKQKLDLSADKFDQYKLMLQQNLQNLKASELKQELVDRLKKIYPIKIYYKGN